MNVLGQPAMESVAEVVDQTFDELGIRVDFAVIAFEHGVGPEGCAIIGNYADQETLLAILRTLTERIERGDFDRHV